MLEAKTGTGSEDETGLGPEDETGTGLRNTYFRDIVSQEGTMLYLKGGGVHIKFPPDAVTEPRMIAVHRWKRGACSPHLHEHEALVSNVIEISTDHPAGLDFKEQVTLGLSHSATDLKGYEVVVKQLIDRKNNSWQDMKTNDVRRQSEIKRGNEETSEIPELAVSVAEAKINTSSSSAVFAAVCRLKCYTGFTITSLGTDVSIPDYPKIKLSVPKNAVPAGMQFHLSIKVQEVPCDEFKHKNIYPGPILRISCSQNDEFLQPVTIQMPISLREDSPDDIPNLRFSRVRVLSRKSDDEKQAWTAITGDLHNPIHFDGELVTFQVHHFCRFAVLREWRDYFAVLVFGDLYTSYMGRGPPQKAAFTAYLDSKTLDKLQPNSRTLLNLCCCPTHQRGEKEQELSKKDVHPKWANSMKELLRDAKVYVFPTDAAEPYSKDELKDFHLIFFEEPFEGHLRILIVKEGFCCVKFRSNQEEEDRSNTLCTVCVEIPFERNSELPSSAPRAEDCSSTTSQTNLSLTSAPMEVQEQSNPSSSSNTKSGTPLDEELEVLAEEIGDAWKKLGRRLKIEEEKLTGFHNENEKLSEKAFQMLLGWKRSKGPVASYQELYDALCDSLVSRTDLAYRFCCVER